MIQLVIFSVCFLGLVIHALITYHKYKFNKIDKLLFTLLFGGCIFSIVTTLFNFNI